VNSRETQPRVLISKTLELKVESNRRKWKRMLTEPRFGISHCMSTDEWTNGWMDGRKDGMWYIYTMETYLAVKGESWHLWQHGWNWRLTMGKTKYQSSKIPNTEPLCKVIDKTKKIYMSTFFTNLFSNH
jgi:hypothetical protein